MNKKNTSSPPTPPAPEYPAQHYITYNINKQKTKQLCQQTFQTSHRFQASTCSHYRTTNPPRILSTDKKALKADGLMLAQNAQPVLPTDPVDVALDYQLVPID